MDAPASVETVWEGRRSPRTRGGRVARNVGVGLVAFFVILAFLGPHIAPYNPNTGNFLHSLEGLSAQHWFGTDEAGRDVLSRALAGAQLTLGGVAVVVLASTVIGTIIGAVAGLGGDVVDMVLMRVTDLGLAFPSLILALGFAAVLGASLSSAVIAVTITSWPRFARLVRSVVVETRAQDYVLAARELGASRVWIAVRHILPAALGMLLVQMTVSVGSIILLIASLSYVGAGAQPPQAEWGAMIASGQAALPGDWWPVLFPGLAVTFVAIGFSFAGDWLRDRLEEGGSGL